MISRKKIEGIALLLLAAMFFLFPQYMKATREADNKILVATPMLNGGPFDHAVVVVVSHTGYGALGFVLNASPLNPSDPVPGGPVNKDQYFTLHSKDVVDEKTTTVEGLENLGLTQGEAFARLLGGSGAKPAEYIIFKGTASWGMGQLTREIEQGAWKVIPFDRALVFHTDPKKMFELASGK
jgi:putative transcriptional regulator